MRAALPSPAPSFHALIERRHLPLVLGLRESLRKHACRKEGADSDGCEDTPAQDDAESDLPDSTHPASEP